MFEFESKIVLEYCCHSLVFFSLRTDSFFLIKVAHRTSRSLFLGSVLRSGLGSAAAPRVRRSVLKAKFWFSWLPGLQSDQFFHCSTVHSA
jgi:hypothetical protein